MDYLSLINRRLSCQQLAAKDFDTPKAIVSWMGAIQAQDFNMAKWAIGTRLSGSTNKIVQEAFDTGEILRTHVLRPTWHFIAPEDIRWMLQLSAPRIKSSCKSRDRNLEITEELYSQCNRVIEKALEGHKQLTREELSTKIEQSGITINSSRLVHFMMRAELEGIICSGAMQGKKHTYALIEERVPKTPHIDKNEALAKLALTYFNSHGPATLQDFVWWSGISSGEAKQGLESVKQNLISERIHSETYWLSNTSSISPTNNESFHLLPAFDEYLISYKDRLAALSSNHHNKAITSNGIFRPTILKNGKVIGVWKRTALKNKPIEFDFFEKQNQSIYDLLNEATTAQIYWWK